MPGSHRICRAGQLILARDAMYEERYWPVLIARYNDLPIRIRNGQATPESRTLTFPYAVKVNACCMWYPLTCIWCQELMSCKSDYIPVMVPGTNAFGWVPTIFCKPFDKNLAMTEYKESLKAPEEPCDVSFRRCLKGNGPFSFLWTVLFCRGYGVSQSFSER